MQKPDLTFLMRRVLIKFFWDNYDFLGRLVIMNALLFLFGAVLFLVIYAAGTPVYHAMNGHPLRQQFMLLSVIIIFGFMFSGFSFSSIIYFANKIKNDSEPVFKDFFIGIKKYGIKMTFLGFFVGIIEVILALNIVFYTNGKFIDARFKFPAMILAGICFWGVFIVLLYANYIFSFMISQEAGIKQTLKTSFTLLVDNIILALFTFGIFIILLFLSFISKGLGLFFFGISFSGILLNAFMETTVLKYKMKENIEKAEKEKSEEVRITSWKQKRQIQEEKDSQEYDRYNRTLRDIIKPWEN